jgi:hypothetical protein
LSSKTCLLHFLCFYKVYCCYGNLHRLFLVSAASDVDPSNIGGLRTTEPAVADKDAAGQTACERPVEQPAAVSVTETTEEDPA